MVRFDYIKELYQSAPKKIRAILRRQRWNEALIFFFFILLSFGFWLLQSLQQDYEIEISIPVRYKNIPPNIAFTTTPPEKIQVKVKDKGSVLLNYTFGRKFLPIDVQLKKQETGAGELKVSRKEIESDISKQLLASTTIETFEPQHIALQYHPREKKEIPVQFDGHIETAAGFQVSGAIEIQPANVQVYASSAILDTLKFVQTMPFTMENAKKTFSHQLMLSKKGELEYVPEAVMITVHIEEYTEKTLEIPVTCEDLPADLTLRTFPATIKVTCSVPLSKFKELETNDFSINIHYADLQESTSGTLPIAITRQPAWADRISVSPQKVEFVLEQKVSIND